MFRSLIAVFALLLAAGPHAARADEKQEVEAVIAVLKDEDKSTTSKVAAIESLGDKKYVAHAPRVVPVLIAQLIGTEASPSSDKFSDAAVVALKHYGAASVSGLISIINFDQEKYCKVRISELWKEYLGIGEQDEEFAESLRPHIFREVGKGNPIFDTDLAGVYYVSTNDLMRTAKQFDLYLGYAIDPKKQKGIREDQAAVYAGLYMIKLEYLKYKKFPSQLMAQALSTCRERNGAIMNFLVTREGLKVSDIDIRVEKKMVAAMKDRVLLDLYFDSMIVNGDKPQDALIELRSCLKSQGGGGLGKTEMAVFEKRLERAIADVKAIK